MSTVTADVRVAGARRLLEKTRAALAQGCRRGVTVVGAARRRYRRPALTIAGLGCADASAWHTFGFGAGMAAIAVSLFVYEWLGGEDA